MRLIHKLFVLALIASAAQADQAELNGNMWLTLSIGQKTFYTAGFLDGMSYGIPYGGAALSRQTNKFVKITPQQIIDGFDKLYADYRNRRIPMVFAMDVVIDSINGESDANTEKHLEILRKKIGEYLDEHGAKEAQH